MIRLLAVAAAMMLSACAHDVNAKNGTSSDTGSFNVTSALSSEGEPVVIGQTYTIASTVLGADRRLSVRLPSGYKDNPDTSYPVVYLIDGGPEQDFPHIAGIAQSRDLNWTFAPFILVGVETVNRRDQITPSVADLAPYNEWIKATPGGSAQFRQFLREDVMPWVETRYRTSGQNAVMGESLAGLFVVETLLEEPDLFDDYIAVSPSMWWEEKKYGREAAAYLAQMPAGKRRLYLTMADEGYYMQEGLDFLVAALEERSPEGLRWVYIDRGDSETHASIYHTAALDAFRLFYPEPSRIYRQTPLLNGELATPRTPEQETLAAQECKVETAMRTTPKDTRVNQEQYAYRCFLYDYGATATAGNWE